MILPAKTSAEPAETDGRCACGSLLARLGPRGVELKCRRCRRLVVIPWDTGRRWRAIPGAVTSELVDPAHRSAK